MSKRLTKHAWIQHGLQTVMRDGVRSLSAGPMATALGVSRGSFYWHFDSMAEFEKQLMIEWKRITTESVIEDLTSDETAETRLLKLVELAFSNDLKMDKAMRAWATQDARAKQLVAAVDQQRINYVRELITEAIRENKSVSKKEIEVRAKVLYWSTIGKSMMSDTNKSELERSDIQRLISVFLS